MPENFKNGFFSVLDRSMVKITRRTQQRQVERHNEIVEECAKLAGEVSEQARLAVLAFKISDE